MMTGDSKLLTGITFAQLKPQATAAAQEDTFQANSQKKASLNENGPPTR